MKARAFVELFAGTAAVSLRLLGCDQPPCGYMGSKRRLAPDILHAFGLRTGQGAEAIVLCDAGPWGHVWEVLAGGGSADVAAVLDGWASEDPVALWRRLAEAQPPEGAAEHAAAFLWLQARAASTVPVWWEDARGAVMSGAGPINPRTGERYSANVTRSATPGGWALRMAGHRSDLGAAQRKPPKQKGQNRQGCGGIMSTATIARRLDRIAALDWPRVLITRSHPTPASVAAWLGMKELSGVAVYMDPPYVGCTSYAVDCPRDDVVDLARGYAEAGATVAVFEAEPLAIEGWHAVDVTLGRKSEWLTMSSAPVWAPAEQVALWGAA